MRGTFRQDEGAKGLMRLGLAIAAGALALAAAGGASAQVAPRTRVPTPSTAPTPNFTTRNAWTADANQFGPDGGSQRVQWDERGRWGVRLDLQNPVGRERELADVEAGAFLRLSPSLRVGGAMRFAEQPRPNEITPRDRNPRVRLETTLAF